MLRQFCALLAFGGCAAFALSAPAEAATLKIKVDSVKSGGMIANKYAFCVAAAQGHAKGGANINPSVSWSQGPKGTQSYAVVLFDTDSPKEQREKMNKEGETLTSAVARQTFYHWILVDIPANVRSIKEGADSNARVVHGKPAASTVGVKGLNDFTRTTAGNEAMKGQYFGYDGPCPPWNDENLHHYHFRVFALSVKSLGLAKEFDATTAMEAMKGKVLAEGKLDTIFTTNPAKGAKVEK
ncbi:MAG TPA: YbhB/YbcL family Raf kinase inhibitor-like protein [Pseudolabrys sp.]